METIKMSDDTQRIEDKSVRFFLLAGRNKALQSSGACDSPGSRTGFFVFARLLPSFYKSFPL